MTWPWVKRILIIAIASALTVWAIRQFVVSDTDRIQQQLAKMKRAIEFGQIRSLSDYIAADYTDNLGFDKRTVLAFIHTMRRQYDAVLIHISDMDMTVAPDRTTARVNLRVHALSANVHQVTQAEICDDRYRLDFRRDGRTWKLYRADKMP
jgi:hypothetical protein